MVIYVDSTRGNDAVARGSAASPFKSLHGALAARPAAASSKYILLIQAGTYASECPLELFNVTIIGATWPPTIVCDVPSQWSITGLVDIENVAFDGVRLVATWAQLSLTRVSIRGIEASRGGCVAAVRSYLWVNRVDCVGGRAKQGGGIHLENSVMVGRTLNVSHNLARQGGGVYIGQRSHWLVSGADIASNVAQDDGGGIHACNAARVDIHSTRFNSNTANRDGGAILASNVSITIEHSRLQHCRAGRHGGGISADRRANITVRSTQLVNNSALGFGGGVHLRAFASTRLVLVDSNLTANTAARHGAGVAGHDSCVQLQNARLLGHRGVSAIALRSSLLAVVGSTFEGNDGVDGGAISLRDAPLATIERSYFLHNAATGNGGAIAATSSHLMLVSTTFSSNSALEGYGGAVGLLGATASATVKVSRFFDNIAAFGGAVGLFGDARVTVITTNMTRNRGTERGDAVFSPHGAAQVDSNDSIGAIASGPVQLVPRAWPETLVSGFVLGASSKTTVPERRDWPWFQVVDAYNQSYPATTDWSCSWHVAGASVERTGRLWIEGGRIVLRHASVTGPPGTYEVHVRCDLPWPHSSLFSNLQLRVTECPVGFFAASTSWRCVRCPPGQTSLGGIGCFPCPLGVNCEPATALVAAPGYTLAAVPSSASTTCDPSLWSSTDPCLGYINASVPLEQSLYTCMSNTPLLEYKKHWPASRVFACVTNLSSTPCSVIGACAGNATCAEGYDGVGCSVCAASYARTASGACVACTSTETSLAHVNWVVIPGAFLILCIWSGVAISSFLTDDSEAYLLHNAQADRAFKKGHVAPSNGRPRKRRVSTEYRDERGCWGFLHSTLLFRHYQHTQNQHHVFGVKYESPVLVLHPEKIKLLLGFLQIFGNFYTNYKTVWPPSVKDAMQASSQFNLDWLSMIRINCLLSTNYFGIFLLTLASMAVFLGILRVFDWRGTYLYKAKLDRIPRSCLHCGFPVLESLSRDAYATLQQQFGDGQLIARRGSLVAHKQCHVAIKRTIGTSQAHATGLPVYMSHHQVCPLLHRLQTAQMKERLLRSNLRVWQARVKLRLNLQLYKAKCFRLGIWLLLCTYPMVAQKVLSIFHCERTSTAYVLVVDRTLTCFSSEWFLYAGVAGVGVALWVVGVPVLFGLLIYRARIRRVDDRVRVLRQPHFAALRAKWLREMRAHLVLGRNERKYTPMSKFLDVQDYYLGVYMQQRNLQDPLVLSRIGFIYNNYDVRYWYCEVVDLVRRLLMSVGVVFLDSMLAQALVGMLICFLTMALLLFLKPYKQWTDTLVSSVMQFQLCLTLFLGIVHTSAPQDGNAERIAMVILGSGLATVVLAGVLICKEVLDSSRTDLAAMRHRRRAAIQVQVRLRWQRAYRWALFEACTAGVYRPHGRVCIPAMLHLVREATSELRQQHRRLYDHD